ncbi:hypothetical protein BKA93DRAFT_599240 [Sparassis latifolia]
MLLHFYGVICQGVHLRFYASCQLARVMQNHESRGDTIRGPRYVQPLTGTLHEHLHTYDLSESILRRTRVEVWLLNGPGRSNESVIVSSVRIYGKTLSHDARGIRRRSNHQQTPSYEGETLLKTARRLIDSCTLSSCISSSESTSEVTKTLRSRRVML